MKSSRLIFCLLAFIGLASLGTLIISNQAFSQTNNPQGKVVKPGEGVTWKQNRIPISLVNSELNVHLPTLSRDPNWIVGVSPIKPSEKEEIAIGVVDWTSFDIKNRPGMMRIANVSNYQPDSVSVSPGQIIIKDLPNFRDSGQSLIIFIKTSQMALINIFQQDKFLGNRKTDRGFAIQNNLPVIEGNNNVSKLLTQLQTERLIKSMGAKQNK